MDEIEGVEVVRVDPPVGVIRRSSVREDIVEALRAALISGSMRPGEVYSAPALASDFGVSATPVREAMLELVREDMVEVLPNKGFRVRRPTDAELDELVEMRLLLEVPIMGRVAAAYVEQQRPRLEELRRLAVQIEGAAAEGNLVEYIQLDTEFHTGFLALHGNASLVQTVRGLRGRSRLYGLETLSRSGRLVETVREHAELIDRAIDSDVAGIEELTTRHIGRVRTIWASGERRPPSS
ncbi:GntR family transcriptional regulator [Nocardioides sp. InS609-2]|uniref:GntR family transcriptional regulator n=1 Tax=Nocardioides sp. InS609-2 TaxID=2760705 RepID=UPI0020BEAD05|nr:GntR family transcriptional regulator [Nocardioides sp. InS609-2]